MNRVRWIGGFLFVCILLAAWQVRVASGLCFDEPKRVASSLTMLEHGTFAARDGTPVSIVFGLPFSAQERAAARDWNPIDVRSGFAIWQYGVEFLERTGPPDALRRARLPAWLAFALLLVLVAWEGFRLAGTSGLVAALALVGTSPALLSHAGLVSPDILAATASVAFTMTLRAFLDRGGALRGALVALLAGLAIATKLTCVAVVGTALVATLVRPQRDVRRTVAAVIASGFGLLLADVAYRAFASSLVEPIDAAREFAGSDLLTYFLGEFGDPGPWFYPVLLFGKSTPLLLTTLVIGAACLAFPHARRALHRSAWVAHGAPALGLLVALVISDYPQGYRFLLPAFALLALCATPALAAGLNSSWRPVRIAAGSAIAAQLIAVAAAHPDHLAYWNAFVGGFERGSRIAVDSNADWGQATPALRTYAADHDLETVFGLLNTIEPLDRPFVGLPALASHLANASKLDRCAIAISMTYVRTTQTPAERARNPLYAFVSALDDLAPAATVGHAIRVWRFTPEVEALARAHLGMYLHK